MSKLAILGGAPVRSRSWPGWPLGDGAEKAALAAVVDRGVYGTLGPEALAFAAEYAAYQQARYAVAVSSGTAALETLLRALDIGPGDEVILPPYTFIATASAVLMAGATPVFADIEADTFNLDPKALPAALTPRTRAVLPVHVGGRPADMDGILAFAAEHGLAVIEDGSHANGSEWKGRRVGALGSGGAFSFQNSKNIAGGEGGCVVTNDEAVYERCWSVHNSGRAMADNAEFGYAFLGGNNRMNEWTAAVLRVQLSRLDGHLARRTASAAALDTLLPQTGVLTPCPPDPRITRVGHHLYMARYNAQAAGGLPRAAFLRALAAEGVPVSAGYGCLYSQPVFHGEQVARITGGRSYDIRLPVAEQRAADGVWLTQNMLLDPDCAGDVADAVAKVAGHAGELKNML